MSGSVGNLAGQAGRGRAFNTICGVHQGDRADQGQEFQGNDG